MYTHDEGIALSLISARTLENCFCLSTGTFSFVFAMLSSLCVKKNHYIFSLFSNNSTNFLHKKDL